MRNKVLAVFAALTATLVTVGLLTREEATALPEKLEVRVTVGEKQQQPTHLATCAVRFDDACRQMWHMKQYDTVQMPVTRIIHDKPEKNESGGEDDATLYVEVQLPPSVAKQDGEKCLDSMDWQRCRYVACEKGACDKWQDAQPFAVVRAVSTHVIPDCRDEGGRWDDKHAPVDCLGVGPFGNQDGSPRWRGCNVTPREYATGAACLDAPTDVVLGGESLVDSL